MSAAIADRRAPSSKARRLLLTRHVDTAFPRGRPHVRSYSLRLPSFESLKAHDQYFNRNAQRAQHSRNRTISRRVRLQTAHDKEVDVTMRGGGPPRIRPEQITSDPAGAASSSIRAAWSIVSCEISPGGLSCSYHHLIGLLYRLLLLPAASPPSHPQSSSYHSRKCPPPSPRSSAARLCPPALSRSKGSTSFAALVSSSVRSFFVRKLCHSFSKMYSRSIALPTPSDSAAPGPSLELHLLLRSSSTARG